MFYAIGLLSLSFLCMSSLEGVLTRGKVFKLEYEGRKTTTLLLYDIHQISRFADTEVKQTEALIEAVAERSLRKDSYLSILAEQALDFEVSHKEPISCFIKGLNEEVTDLYGTAENIEQRGASALVEDLIKVYPHHNEYTNTRCTTTKAYYPQEVTLQDVCNEFDKMDGLVKEAYHNATGRALDIYREKIGLIDRLYFCFKGIITEYEIPTDMRFCQVLDHVKASEEDHPEFFQTIIRKLGKFMCDLGCWYFELYILDKILSAPDGQTTIVLAGAQHCRYVLGEILGRLNATGTFCYGPSGVYRQEDIQPLTQEQIVELIAHC